MLKTHTQYSVVDKVKSISRTGPCAVARCNTDSHATNFGPVSVRCPSYGPWRAVHMRTNMNLRSDLRRAVVLRGMSDYHDLD